MILERLKTRSKSANRQRGRSEINASDVSKKRQSYVGFRDEIDVVNKHFKVYSPKDERD
jgi:hypothetical protein